MMGIKRQWEAKPAPGSCHWKTNYLNMSQEPLRPNLLPPKLENLTGCRGDVGGVSSLCNENSPEPDAVIA